MSTLPGQIHKNIISDLIKKRMIEKIDALFKLGTASQDKHAEINRATLNSVINNPDANLDELQEKMINAINSLDLEQYALNEQKGYEAGVIACIKALQDLGIATEKWNFGSHNIQDVLISTWKKLQADSERAAKEKIIEQLKSRELLYQDLPENYKESDAFIIELIDLELKLKQEGIEKEEIDKNDFVLIHPFQLLDEQFSTRPEKTQTHILKLFDTMPSLTMRQLAKPNDDLQESMEEFNWKLNKSIAHFTLKNDANALKFLPKKYQQYEELLEAALIKNAAQLEFIPEAMKQKLIDKIGAEKLLQNNVLAYKYFPKNLANTQAINSFLSKIENIVVNPSLNDAELRDATLVYGNKEKRKDKTAFVGFNFNSQLLNDSNSKDIQKELDDLMLAMKAANNQKDIRLAVAAHSNTGSKNSIGFISLDHIAELCEKHGEIKQINLLTCSAAGEQYFPEKEQKMMADLRAKAEGTKKYLFVKRPHIISEESLKNDCRKLCEKNNADGVYFLTENKQSTPRYKLQIMKIVDNELVSKTVAIPLNKEKFIQRFETQQNEKVKKNSGNLTPLSFTELIELRSTTAEQHRFDPNHPKFKKDKERFPFLAKFEIPEQDLKESKMKSLVEALKKKKVSQEIQIQAYTGFMEVDTETNYLRATTGHTFHLDGYKSGVDRVKVITQHKDMLSEIIQGEVKSSRAKKVTTTLNAPNAHEEKIPDPDKQEEVQPEIHKEAETTEPDEAAAPEPVTPIAQLPEVFIDLQIKLKDELSHLKNKCPNLVSLEQTVSEKIKEIKLKSIDLANEKPGFYISSESANSAKIKANIINTFLENLEQATTVEEYQAKIHAFVQSNDYKTLGEARNSFFQAMNWLGTSAGLIDDLHQAALEYVNKKNSASQATLM